MPEAPCPSAEFEAKLLRAAQAGEFAAMKLAGRLVCVPKTPPASHEQTARKKHFVLIRGAANESGYINGFYREAVAAYVERQTGRLDPKVIFHGFCSLDEAHAYWFGAGGQQQWTVLPQRRQAEHHRQ